MLHQHSPSKSWHARNIRLLSTNHNTIATFSLKQQFRHFTFIIIIISIFYPRPFSMHFSIHTTQQTKKLREKPEKNEKQRSIFTIIITTKGNLCVQCRGKQQQHQMQSQCPLLYGTLYSIPVQVQQKASHEFS